MNCNSTLGFAPTRVTKKHFWETESGYKELIYKIEGKLSEKSGMKITLSDENEIELQKLLKSTHFVTSSDVDQMINYYVQMMLGRLRLKQRLDSIKENPIRSHKNSQSDRKSGSLPGFIQKNSGSNYWNFLEQQKSFR
jgi:hypothetical protein